MLMYASDIALPSMEPDHCSVSREKKQKHETLNCFSVGKRISQYLALDT